MECAPFLKSGASDVDMAFVVIIQRLAHANHGDGAFGFVHEHVTRAKAHLLLMLLAATLVAAAILAAVHILKTKRLIVIETMKGAVTSLLVATATSSMASTIGARLVRHSILVHQMLIAVTGAAVRRRSILIHQMLIAVTGAAVRRRCCGTPVSRFTASLRCIVLSIEQPDLTQILVEAERAALA